MLVCMLITVLVWGAMVVTDEPIPTEATTYADQHDTQ